MGHMAKTVIVKLIDDLDGGDADETVSFALDGRSYEIDVSVANVARLRDALKPFVEKARVRGGSAARYSVGHQDTLLPVVRGREDALSCLGGHGNCQTDQRRPGEGLGGRRQTLTR